MLKNMLKNLRSWWRNKIEDRTLEWEETDTPEQNLYSKYAIVVKSSFLDRLKFVFTNHLVYRLTRSQFLVIYHNPMKEDK